MVGYFSEVASHSPCGHEPDLVLVCLCRGKGQLSECEPHRSHAKAFVCYDTHATVRTSYCLDRLCSSC